MDTKALEDLGLTQAEIKAYLALLELGSSTAGHILERSQIQNSVLHRALNTLIEKGLVNYVLEGRRKLYQASDPSYFLNLAEEKKHNIQLLLPELEKHKGFAAKAQSATIYKGIRGVKEAYAIMIANKGTEYLTFGGGPPTAQIMGFPWWMNLHQRRIANKLPSRQVFDESVRTQGQPISKLPLTTIRFLSADFAQFQETVIVGNKVAINVFSETPYAFVIDDQKVAEGYRKYFEILWKQAN